MDFEDINILSTCIGNTRIREVLREQKNITFKYERPHKYVIFYEGDRIGLIQCFRNIERSHDDIMKIILDLVGREAE
jgi:hypothetical protein